jgi:hypothetical protein
MGEGPERTSRDAIAGAANTPPFEGNEPHRESGRPPSHREFDPATESARDRERMEGIAPASGPAAGRPTDRAAEAARRAEEEAGEALDRAGRRIDETAETAADRLEAAADRVRGRAREMHEEPGWRGSAARWAEQVAESGDDAANYLRNSGIDDFRGLVERQVRERPLRTILLSLAAGWLVGKLLR